jgi:hypothetical protein
LEARVGFLTNQRVTTMMSRLVLEWRYVDVGIGSV